MLLVLPGVPARASEPAPVSAAPSVVGPAAGACQIRILGTKKVRGSLRAAVAAAAKNQRLSVKGTCRGTARIDKSLTILGARGGSGPPTLDGAGKGPVIIVPAGVKVTILSVDITGGVTDKADGAALSVGGTVVYQGGRIHDNRTTADAAAIGIRSSGKVTLGGGADIHYNDAPDGGSVVRVAGGTLVLTGTAEIHANVGSGVHGLAGASVVVGGEAAIHHNTAASRGGGVWLEGGGSLTLKEAASITNNTVTNGLGGGILLDGGTVSLAGDALVKGNDVTGVDAGHGGGIHVAAGALILSDKSVVGGNRSSGDGGGVSIAAGTMVMSPDARIRSNIAGGRGGGLFRDASVTPEGVDCGVNVKDNSPGNCASNAPPP